MTAIFMLRLHECFQSFNAAADACVKGSSEILSVDMTHQLEVDKSNRKVHIDYLRNRTEACRNRDMRRMV